MLSCFAPFTTEEAWERLAEPASVSEYAGPEADPALVAQETVTCVVQVAGKVRDRLEVPPGIVEDELCELALRSEKVINALDGTGVLKVVVRAPRLVNVVPAR